MPGTEHHKKQGGDSLRAKCQEGSRNRMTYYCVTKACIHTLARLGLETANQPYRQQPKEPYSSLCKTLCMAHIPSQPRHGPTPL